MPESGDQTNATERLLEADATLQRVLQACKRLEQASHQLDAAQSDVLALANTTKHLIASVQQVATDALGAVGAVKAIEPSRIYAKLDEAEAVTHAAQRSVIRAVCMCSVSVTVVLGLLVLFRT